MIPTYLMGTVSNAEQMTALHLTQMPRDPFCGPPDQVSSQILSQNIILIRSWSSDRWGDLSKVTGWFSLCKVQSLKSSTSAFKSQLMVASCVTLSPGSPWTHYCRECCPLLVPYTDVTMGACFRPTLNICLCATEWEMIEINSLWKPRLGLVKNTQSFSWPTLR